jgi:hypothetical protein
MLALALLSVSAIYIYQAQFKIPGLLIGISSFIMLALKLMHEITFSQELVSNNYNAQGQIISTTFEFTFWQSALIWANPIGWIVIACGVLVLSRQLRTLSQAAQLGPRRYSASVSSLSVRCQNNQDQQYGN